VVLQLQAEMYIKMLIKLLMKPWANSSTTWFYQSCYTIPPEL